MAKAKELFPEVKEFFFDDDTFTADLTRAAEIAKGLGKLGIMWSCNSRANVPFEYLKIFKDNGSQIWFDRAHNIIFDVGVATGFVGLAIYLAIYWLAAYYLVKTYRISRKFNESWLLIAALIAFFLQDFFVFDQLNSDVVFYLLLGFIIYVINTTLFSIPATTSVGNWRRVAWLPIISVVAVLVTVIFQVNYKVYAANHTLFTALVAKTREYDQAVVDDFKKSLSYRTTGLFEARQQLANYAMELNTDNKENLEKNKSS